MASTFESSPRTSCSHPLQIAEICVGAGLGRIGMTFAPGKKQRHAETGPWERDLDTDLDAIAAWNAAAVASLIEDHEIEDLQIGRLGREVARRHMEWHHLPIRDYDVASAAFEETGSKQGRGSAAC